MIVLKADTALLAVFKKTMNVMGQNVEWNGTFGFNNNTLILPGTLKSLLFSFDNKKVIGTVLEKELQAEEKTMPQNRLLENAVNMVLYVFGKWGKIKGLTVEKNFGQLNTMLNSILSEVAVQAEVGPDNCRFYKDNIRITYEEVIELILDYIDTDAQAEEETAQAEDTTGTQNAQDWRQKMKLGLWHKLVWQSDNKIFTKQSLSAEQRQKSRIGKDFYITHYQCPECRGFLHMVVYPQGKEFTIETDQGRVVLARAYTCNACKCFYTPKPDKMLVEGDIFTMDFEGDDTAYQDYLELVGRDGERTSNANFNWYEGKQHDGNADAMSDIGRLKNLFDNIQELSDDALFDAVDRMDSCFYPFNAAAAQEERAVEELKRRGMSRDVPPKGYHKTNRKEQTQNIDNAEKIDQTENTKQVHRQDKAENAAQTAPVQPKPAQEKNKMTPEQVSVQVASAIQFAEKQDMEGFAQQLDTFSEQTLKAVKAELENRSIMQENAADWSEYTARISAKLVQKQQKSLLDLIAGVKDKGYDQMKQVYQNIQAKDYPDSVKAGVLDTLRTWMSRRADRELQVLLAHVPDKVTRRQYLQFYNKFQEYDAQDSRKYIEQLNQKRDLIEQQEIADFIKKNNRRPKERTALLELAQNLTAQDFEERNKKPYIDKIMEQVRAMDTAAINRICPEVFDLTFEEGLAAYQKISQGNFLPELKADILARINKRLETIKKDECRNLVNKLMRDTEWKEGSIEGLYLYDVRRMGNDNCDDTDAIIFHNAVYNYAAGQKYEYPLLVYDATRGGSGKKGFLLTPDRLCYNTSMLSGSLAISEIKAFSVESGLFHKGIYVTNMKDESIRLAANVKADKNVLETYLKKLNRFIKYLKEKPDSRKIEYLVQEKHEIKCCFRCGYRYKQGDICPKCGSRNNH